MNPNVPESPRIARRLRPVYCCRCGSWLMNSRRPAVDDGEARCSCCGLFGRIRDHFLGERGRLAEGSRKFNTLKEA